MGEDIVEMVLAGSEVLERPELGQELFQKPQRLHKQEMPAGAFYREYLEKLVPDALRRRRGDKVRLCPDMLRGRLFDVEPEGRGKPHCPEQTERVLIQHLRFRHPYELLTD